MDKETLRTLVRFGNSCCDNVDCEDCRKAREYCRSLTDGQAQINDARRLGGIMAGIGILGVCLLVHAFTGVAVPYSLAWWEGVSGAFAACSGLIAALIERQRIVETT